MNPIKQICVCILAAFSLGLAASVPAHAVDKVKVGVNGLVSDAAFHIANELGYFKEQDIEIEFVNFPAGPAMIAPLGTAEIDVGGGATSAGMYNAVARGINIRAVAGKGSTPPGYEYFPILIRKDLFDSGKVKTFADLRGLKVAEGGQGGGQAPALNKALEKGGMTYNDVKHVYLGYSKHIPALTNKSVDFSVTAEPLATLAVKRGIAVKFPELRYYPNQQAAVLLYSGDFIKNRRDVASRFMIAYVKAARYYNDALNDGGFNGPRADEVIKILVAKTKIKDPALYRVMVPNGVNPDGKLNLKSLRQDYKFYSAQGYIEKPVKLSTMVDTSFAENAVKVLGPYKPAK